MVPGCEIHFMQRDADLWLKSILKHTEQRGSRVFLVSPTSACRIASKVSRGLSVKDVSQWGQNTQHGFALWWFEGLADA